jgi:hypothetical protein
MSEMNPLFFLLPTKSEFVEGEGEEKFRGIGKQAGRNLEETRRQKITACIEGLLCALLIVDFHEIRNKQKVLIIVPFYLQRWLDQVGVL